MNWFTLLLIAFIALHQDFWNWRAVYPFVLGLPVGLWYHVLYTLCSAGVMILLVRYRWPENLEEDEADSE